MADADARRWLPTAYVLAAAVAATALAAAVLEYDQDTRCESRLPSWTLLVVAVVTTLAPVLVAWRLRRHIWLALALSVGSAVALALLFNVGQSYDCLIGPLFG